MKIIVCILLSIFQSLSTSADDLADFISKADTFFKANVREGTVAYQRISSNKSEIEKLIKSIATMDLSGVADNSKKAFYINAYNLLVIHSISTHYPVKSPMDIAGFFDKKKHSVAGSQLTLNELEKEKLLSPYNDPRFHFVLVCAAKSCPLLMSGAYRPEMMEAQLHGRTKLTINDKTWLKVNPSAKTIEISKIFEWYAGDFTKNDKNVLEWINRYRDQKIPDSYKVAYYEYNWSLNE